VKDLTGKIYGRLTALSVESKGHSVFWKCSCECSQTTIATTSQLTLGNKKSCGCLRKEITSKLRETSGGNTLDSGQSHFNKIYYQYRKDAQKRNIQFSISREEFKKIIDRNCHYCEAEPSTGFVEKKRNGSYLHNGIDRKINSLGYNIDNCLPCCSRCNKMKMNLDYHDFLAQCGVIYLLNKERKNGTSSETA
jgi:hypothetical protein